MTTLPESLFHEFLSDFNLSSEQELNIIKCMRINEEKNPFEPEDYAELMDYMQDLLYDICSVCGKDGTCKVCECLASPGDPCDACDGLPRFRRCKACMDDGCEKCYREDELE